LYFCLFSSDVIVFALYSETAAGKYPIEAIKSMASVVREGDIILDGKDHTFWNLQMHEDMSPIEQELDAVAASAVKSASTMNVSKIMLITRTGRVARAVARHKPSVPVLAFCTDPQVARRLQLHRGITPIMLQTYVDPLAPLTSLGLLRAEALRTATEVGFVKSGDRIIVVDQTTGKPTDMHEVAHNMKVITIRSA
jgi:pyruvate kinase